MPGYRITWKAQGRAHLPEHPPVLRHDGAREPAGGAAQPADDRLRLHLPRRARRRRLRARPSGRRSRRRATGSRRSRLIDRADDPAGDLPYGAQRRLEIARAMCTDPVLLCLDEPAAGLNPREIARSSTSCCMSIRDEHGTSILLIEHDMSVVMEISDHVVVLDYGIKIADGTPARGPQRPERHRRLSRRRGRGGREGRGGDRRMSVAGINSSSRRRAPPGRGAAAAPQRARRQDLSTATSSR